MEEILAGENIEGLLRADTVEENSEGWLMQAYWCVRGARTGEQDRRKYARFSRYFRYSPYTILCSALQCTAQPNMLTFGR